MCQTVVVSDDWAAEHDSVTCEYRMLRLYGADFSNGKTRNSCLSLLLLTAERHCVEMDFEVDECKCRAAGKRENMIPKVKYNLISSDQAKNLTRQGKN